MTKPPEALKFTVRIDRPDLMEFLRESSADEIAGFMRNTLEKAGICYYAKVEPQ